MPVGAVTDQFVNIREANRVARNLEQVLEGEESPIVIAALMAQLITRLVGPVQWEHSTFANVISEAAQCIQTIAWTAGKIKQ